MFYISDRNIVRFTEKQIDAIIKKVQSFYAYNNSITCYEPCDEDEADVKVVCDDEDRYYAATDAPISKNVLMSINVHDVNTELLEYIVNSVTRRKNGIIEDIFYEDGIATIYCC